MPGNLPLSHGNLPLSTTTPASVVPWPPRYLVALCTTMSAPSAIGLHSAGLGTVLSITSGTPCACATSATAAMSSTTRLGLPSDSAYTARVFGRIAAAKAAGSVASTKVVSMPNFFRFTASIVTLPPYSAPAATTWSPAVSRVISAIASAAMPLALATAARPPSSAATRSSSAATVGFDSREYTLPKVCRLNRLAAWSALSKTKLVVW